MHPIQIILLVGFALAVAAELLGWFAWLDGPIQPNYELIEWLEEDRWVQDVVTYCHRVGYFTGNYDDYMWLRTGETTGFAS